MFKRILVLTLTAVCLAAALLVLYNFTAEKHASRVANFLYAPPARAHILTADTETNHCGDGCAVPARCFTYF